MTILVANPQAQYLSHQVEIDQAIAAALRGNRYILGPQTQAFEAEFAAYLGLKHSVGVGSGTEALHLAIRALDIGPGDEVITVAHTAVATVAAIELSGATPVLVDIDPHTYTIDPAKIEAALTPRTRAIIPVHLYGGPADLSPILDLAQRFDLKLIEDCAQAHGARYHGQRVGSWSDVACFSFYPTKNLGAIGDGGLVATNDPALYERLSLLRQYGWHERYISDLPGWNTRLDELQAAILRVKLRHLDADNAKRRRLASMYNELLYGVPNLVLPTETLETEHVYHLYVIRHPRRDELAAYLREKEIGTAIHYPMPIHLQPAYRGRLGDVGSLPATEQAATEILSLPMYPELAEEVVITVANAIREFAK
jgi:dTDP-3-amino-3,4,6-trideoxy-alpha-D-glucose transaminase